MFSAERLKIQTALVAIALLILGSCATRSDENHADETKESTSTKAELNEADQNASQNIASAAKSPEEATVAAASSKPAVKIETTLSARSRRLQLESFDKVWETVRDRHWDPKISGVDWDGARAELRPKFASIRRQNDARRIMNDLLGRLQQSHFGVFPGKTNEEELVPIGSPAALSEGKKAARNEDTAGSGLMVAMARRERGFAGVELVIVEDHVHVSRVTNDSPIAKAGVALGWELIAVEGDRLADLISAFDADQPHSPIHRSRYVASLVQATVGQDLAMTFLDLAGKEHKITTPAIAMEGEIFSMGKNLEFPVRFAWEKLDDGVGYLSLSAFGSPASVMGEMNDAMESLADAHGIVLDLRGNPGGIGIMASGLARFFFGESGISLGKMITRASEFKFVIYPNPEPYEGPLAVLIDSGSASTSEIFAGGIQESGRARIFGARSAGQALPSEIIGLPNGDAFQFAFADLVTPKGQRLEGKGVVPDVEANHTRAALLRGEDRALETARQWILKSKEK